MEKGLSRILLIRFSSIGDIILTTPLIGAIKKKYPNIFIDYLTLDEFSPLLKENPNIENLFLFERSKGIGYTISLALSMREYNYDYIVDLHRSARSFIFRIILKSKKKYFLNKHYIKRFLLIAFKLRLYKAPFSIVNRYFNTASRLKVIPFNQSEIWIGRKENKRAINKINEITQKNFQLIFEKSSEKIKDCFKIEKALIKNRDGKIISLMPFAKWKTKEWGDEKFITLGKRITEKTGISIQIVGGTGDLFRAQEIERCIGRNVVSLAGKLTIKETAVALSMSDLIITNDTGVMHIAGAVSIPVIALFGCTTEELGFFPFKTVGKVIEVPLPCRPCTAKGLSECPKKHFKCMNNISVEKVYLAVKELI